MKHRFADYFSIRLFLVSVFGTLALIFVHEWVHVLFFTMNGIKVSMVNLYMTVPVDYPYTISGLRQLVQEYGISNFSIFLVSISAPFISLLIVFLAVILNRKKSSDVIRAIMFPSLLFRTVSLLSMTSRYIDGSIDGTDEAVAASFLNVPSWIFWLFSVLMGGILLIFIILPGKNMKRLLISGLTGGIFGFFGIGFIINWLFFKNTGF